MTTETFPAGILTALQLLALVILPILVSGVMTFILRKVRNDEFDAVPGLSILANLSGLATGLVLIAGSDLGPIFRLGIAFDKDGPWDISWTMLMRDRLHPMHYLSLVLTEGSEGGRLGPVMSAIRLLPIAGLFTAAVVTLRMWGNREAFRAFAAVLVLFAWSAAMTIYVINTGLWLLNALNFWALGVLVVFLYLRGGFKSA